MDTQQTQTVQGALTLDADEHFAQTRLADEALTVDPAVPTASSVPVCAEVMATPGSLTMAGIATMMTTHRQISICRAGAG